MLMMFDTPNNDESPHDIDFVGHRRISRLQGFAISVAASLLLWTGIAVLSRALLSLAGTGG